MTPVFDPLERIAFLEREVARLRKGEECHVARPGEGTYECRHDNLCAACRLRSAEARANRTSYTVGETEWAHRIANAEKKAEEAREARDEARAQLAAADTGAPCDGHRHCCADRRKLAEELLRVRAERDALRSSLARKIRHCEEITEERDALKGKP